jgi:hypothetical protein
VVDNEHEVARNFTWAVLGMEDGIFWHLGGDARPKSQFLIHTWTFLAIISIASQLFLCLFWISLWLRIGVYNTFASKNCVKSFKPPKIQIPTPNTSFWIYQHIHDFTPCSLHSQVTNSLILSWIGVSTSHPNFHGGFELILNIPHCLNPILGSSSILWCL